MPWHSDRAFDEDFGKGAVEYEFDGPGIRGLIDDGDVRKAIAVTQDVVDANSDEIVETEHVLGADDDGTPG
jgi:hypothetical protein